MTTTIALLALMIGSGSALALPQSQSDAGPPRSSTSEEGVIYSEPGHADVRIDIDPETGEEVVTRSGVTHWREVDQAPIPMLAAVSPVQEVLSASISPASGTVGTTASPRIRVDLALPPTARSGDVYPITLNAPWFFTSTRATEIKDANGIVFAVAQPTETVQQGKTSRWGIDIILTDAVDTHAEIRGFLELSLTSAQRRTSFTGPIIATSGATELTRTTGNWVVPAIGMQIESATANGGFGDGKPTVTPVIRVAFNRIPTTGWKVTISNLAPGLTASCLGRVQVQLADENGWIYNMAGNTDGNPCTATSQTFTVTRELAQSLGASGSTPVNLRTTMYGALPNTSYSLRLTSNVAISGQTVWNLRATTGQGDLSEADHLALTTTKTATSSLPSGQTKPSLGDVITYTITTSPGPKNGRSISNVVTTDSLPKGLKFISATNGGVFNPSDQTITWGPRLLTSTGNFTDTVKAEVVEVPAVPSVTNIVTNRADGVCGESDAQSVCKAQVTSELGRPSFAFTKSSEVQDTNENGWLGDEGDKIIYSFSVKNTGETVLSSAKLTDLKLGLKDLECLKGPLSPGKSTTCPGTFTHTIDKADIGAGQVTNTATVCVDPKLGLTCETDSTTTPTVRPAFTFSKSVESIRDASGKLVTGGKASRGDKITYAFSATNTGNVDLRQVYISDALLGVSGVGCLAEGTVLKPGSTAKCLSNPKYTYTVLAKDVSNGEVYNTATGSVPGLPDEKGETKTPVLPDPVLPALPNTGASGSLLLLAGGGGLIATGLTALILQYRYASRHLGRHRS
ncbi:DUF7507 domain-containing protein [Actinomyces minihominis]|uniref:DUF7507 domain-containing protein n=1 Tax=Actinomyces minihominis TaxID=2002838 RepID=UPI0013ECC748|nr:DUF11 domain-containing protein [Actinomyces minihominis]